MKEPWRLPLILRRDPGLDPGEPRRIEGSAPAHSRRDVRQNALDHMRVVVHPELVRHGEEERVRLGDRLVFLELRNEHVRLGRKAPPEDRTRPLVEETDLVAPLPAPAEILSV